MRKVMRKRKNIEKKKVLSLILGFVLCLSVVHEPIYTKAAENVHSHCHCGKHTVGGRCPFSSSSYVIWEAIKDTDGNGKISAEELQTQIQNAQGKSCFYLTADAELASTYVVAADKNLYLCLNGHSLTGTMSDGPVIQVAGTLILTDCSGAGTGKVTHEAGKTGSGIYCTATGRLDMYGGSITGNEATNGGGVCCEGKFYMYGGKITDNKATGNGGGVYLAKDGDVVPTIELNGGEISGNTATDGGGVYNKDLMFTINGTKVSKNKATNGGGICLGSSILSICSLKSGEISGNEATGNGGGVYGDSPFETHGGSITGNHADGQGGGVALSKVCYLDGSIKISGNTAGTDASAKDSNLCFLSSFEDLWCVSVQDDFCGEVSLTVADGATLTKSVVSWQTGAPSGTIKMDSGTGSIDETGNVVDHAHIMGAAGKCIVSTCEKELVASVTPSGGSPVYYTALSSAINAAGAGETVTVLSDAALPNNYKITKGITLDLNGKTVTVNGTNGTLYVLAENVTIQDGNAVSGSTTTGSTTTGGTIKDTEGTLIKVSVGDWNGNSGGLTVEGGTLGNIEIMSGSSFALTGGRIGELGFYYNAGTVKLSGGVLSGIGNWTSGGIKVENFLQTGYALKKTVSGTGSYLGVSERKAVNLTALTGDDYYEVVPAPLTDVTADVTAAEVTYGASSSPTVTVNATQGTASSGKNITYQWFVDGTEESGQTGSSYTFSSTHSVKLSDGTEQPYTVKCEVSCDGYTLEVEKKITVKKASSTAAAGVTDYTYGTTTPSVPEIIDGKNQTVRAGAGSTLSFRSSASFADFIRVELDGVTVHESNYTKREGSTIITLNADFVARIPAGTHQIGIVSGGGTALTTFEVIGQAAVGKKTEIETETETEIETETETENETENTTGTENGALTQNEVTSVTTSGDTDTTEESTTNESKTGNIAPLLWVIALLLCGCGAYVVIRVVGKKRRMINER